MSYAKIVNPATNRSVNTNGDVGKRVLRQYMNEISKAHQSVLDSSCNDFEFCCPTTYFDQPVTEPTKPLFKVGDRVTVTCNSKLISGTIINLNEALGNNVHDEECGDGDGEIFTIDNCECCIDDESSGSVWFLADMERKYFVQYNDNYIDLVFESSIRKP